MRRVLLALLASAAWTVASAQDFSPVCIDARTTAMGNAGVATTGSAYPTFNNAAAPLFEYQSIQASFSYSLFSGDELGKYRLMGAGAYVRLHERHAISFGTRLFYAPRLEDTGRRPGEKAFDLAYGYRVSGNTALAVTLRYIHADDGISRKSDALGFDVGVMSRVPLAIFEGSAVNIGAKISNVGFNWWKDADCVQPLSLIAGSSLFLPVRDSHWVETTAQVGYCFLPDAASGLFGGVGFEYTLMQLLRFRCGGYFSKMCSYGSIGLGVRFFHIQFDVSYSMAKKGLPMSNVVQFNAGLDF